MNILNTINSKSFIFFLSLLLFYGCNNQGEKNLVETGKENVMQPVDSFSILYSIGNQKLSANDFNGAIPVFSKAILLNPNNADPYYCRGYALSAIGKDSAAIVDYNNTIKLNPEYKGAYFSRAVSYGILGQFNNAISDYDKVLTFDSLFSEAWFNRGSIKITIGRENEGLNDIKKAAQLKDPKAIQFLNRNVK